LIIYCIYLCFSDGIDDLISVISTDSRRHDFRSRDMDIEDDRESLKSDLATLPDSSYAGFERVLPPSSTPNKPVQVGYKRRGSNTLIDY